MLSAAGSMLPQNAARAASPSDETKIEEWTFDELMLGREASPLTRILLSDFVPKGKTPLYGTDIRSYIFFVAPNGHISGEHDRVISHATGKEVLLPLFPAAPTHAEEDADVVKLLLASANAAHTVTATGGALTQTALCQACKMVEAHSLIPTALVIHPELLGTLGFVDVPGPDEELDDMVIRAHVQTYYRHGFDEPHYENHPERRLRMLVSDIAPKDTAFVTAQPEYVGVRAVSHDRQVAMGILNDYAVAKIFVTDAKIAATGGSK